MVSIRPDWPKRRVKELLAAETDAKAYYSEDAASLVQELTSPSKLEKGAYIAALRSMAYHSGLLGIIKLQSDPDRAGWQDLSRSLQTGLASFKIRAAMGFPNYSGLDTTRACLLLCTSIALQSQAVAQWLAELIVSSYQKKGPLKHWEASPFEPLALRLACAVQGVVLEQLPRSKKFPELYDDLVSAEDADATQAALSKLVLERVQLVSEAYIDFPPFQYSPFDLFPVEILAHLMVRYSGIPRFDFGVLESPLCDPPLPFPHEKDPLVERVMERAKAILPIVDVDWD